MKRCALLVFAVFTVAAQDLPSSWAELDRMLPELRRSLRQAEVVEHLREVRKAAQGKQERAALSRMQADLALEAELLKRAGRLEELQVLTPLGLARRLATLEKDGREEIILAGLCAVLGQGAEAEDALGRARDRDAALKTETDEMLAQLRREAMPRGGYFRYRGAWLPMEQRDRERALDAALEGLYGMRPRGLDFPFPPSSSRRNAEQAERELGSGLREFFVKGAEGLRAAVQLDYEVVRAWLPSYAQQPAQRSERLAAFDEMAQPRVEARKLIARYAKREQTQVDALRRKLERLYDRYDSFRRSDWQRLGGVKPREADALWHRITAREDALRAIDRYLAAHAGGGLGASPVIPAPRSATTPRHVLPGREQSGLEDVLWILVHHAAGRTLDVIARSEEILRQRDRLTPWERMMAEDLLAEALERYDATCASSLDDEERRFMVVLNRYRRALGLRPFEIEERCNVAARKHAREMRALGYFGHVSPVPRRRTPTDRVRLEGYHGGVGENCLAGSADGRGAFEAWYHSPGHHRNMVSEGIHLGVGATSDHAMWVMVAGGADLSWRFLHRDVDPDLREMLERVANSLDWSGTTEEGRAKILRRAHDLLPFILPEVARLAFPAVAETRSRKRDSWPEYLRFIVEAEVPTDWRPLQIAAVAAAIDGLEIERRAELRARAFALVAPLIEESFGYDPKQRVAKRRKAVNAIRRHWEDVAQLRYRQGEAPARGAGELPVGRPIEGASLKAPLKVLGRSERARLARRFGGGAESERAVERGLRWLASVQDADGGWRARAFATTSARFEGHERALGLGDAEWDVAMTGLSLLAFISAGNTTDQGDYTETVARGAQFLMERIVDYGKFETASSHYMYGHAMATQALCELHAYTGDPRIGVCAQLCVDFLIYAQKKSTGGWRYEAQEDGDMSVTGWVIMALNAALKARLDVAGFRGARRFIDSITWPAYYQVGYTNRHDGGHRRLNAVGMLSRLFIDGDIRDLKVLLNAARLVKDLPARGGVDFYYWYYGTLGMFQLGGRWWKEWHAALLPVLLEGQVNSGGSPFLGSWPPDGHYGSSGGRIYQTALGVLMLTTYYRYERALVPKVTTFTGDIRGKVEPYLEQLRRAESDQVRAVCAAKLVDRFGTVVGGALLAEIADTGRPRAYRKEIAALLPSCCGPEHESLLLDALGKEKEGDIREELARTLEEVSTAASVPVLIAHLGDDRRHVRVFVARALANIGDPEAVDALTRRLEIEADEWCRGEFGKALARLAHGEAVALIVDAALRRDDRGRLATVEGLRLIQDSGLAARLLAAGAAEGRLYDAALRIVREHRGAAAVPLLILLLESADLDLRSESMKLLRAITHVHHNFDPDGTDAARRLAIERWKQWWHERLDEYHEARRFSKQ